MATPGGFPESSSAYAPPTKDGLELEPSTGTSQTPILDPSNQHMATSSAVQSRTVDQALSLLGISAIKKDLIQIGMFGKIKNIGNLSNFHQASMTDTYLLYQTMSYRQRPNAHSEVLFFDFCGDFENWTRTDFAAADPEIRKALRDTLRYQGVYTGKHNISSAASFASVYTLISESITQSFADFRVGCCKVCAGPILNEPTVTMYCAPTSVDSWS